MKKTRKKQLMQALGFLNQHKLGNLQKKISINKNKRFNHAGTTTVIDFNPYNSVGAFNVRG
jgi:hypothetical protein